jgi:hypothetical protein
VNQKSQREKEYEDETPCYLAHGPAVRLSEPAGCPRTFVLHRITRPRTFVVKKEILLRVVMMMMMIGDDVVVGR